MNIMKNIDDEDFPFLSEEDEIVIAEFFDSHPELKRKESPTELKIINEKNVPKYTKSTESYDAAEPWIQTYSGVRFTPLKPDPDAIVIQDIARALSMQCRFNGQVKHFYSVAQHSVLVSHICNLEDRLWGLLHDASEAYISDFSSPLKHSGLFDNYKEVEKKLQDAICVRFGLDLDEPTSVKKADKIILATEGRDVLAMLRPDWFKREKPLPFKIEAWSPEKAEEMFLNRFYELI